MFVIFRYSIYSLRDTPSTGNGDTEEHNNSNNSNKEEEQDDEPVVEELGGGMYLRYSNPVFLRGVNDGFVTSASGFDVLQDRLPRHIVLKPADRRPQQQKRDQRLDVDIVVFWTTDPQQRRSCAQTVVARRGRRCLG